MEKFDEEISELEMQKREVLMEDGKRCLIYYTFSKCEVMPQLIQTKEDVRT